MNSNTALILLVIPPAILLCGPLILALSPIAGLFFLCKCLFQFACFTYRHLFRMPLDLPKAYGEWAIVTGATDGIGKAVAAELIARGMKVLLVSRSEEKLQRVQQELGAHAICCIDYTNFDATAQERLLDACKGKDIGILYNNVGGAPWSMPAGIGAVLLVDKDSYSAPMEKLDLLTSFNVLALQRMCVLFAPNFLKRQKRSAIINLGSSAATSCFMGQATYNADKAWVLHHTQTLATEYDKIDWQCQSPHYTVTPLASGKVDFIKQIPTTLRGILSTKHEWFCVSAEEYAKAACDAIGFGVDVVPHWRHEVAHFIRNLMSPKQFGQVHKEWRLEVANSTDSRVSMILQEERENVIRIKSKAMAGLPPKASSAG